jgi:hypothetical protein
MSVVDSGDLDQQTAEAWTRVKWDCGCPDVFFCPSAEEIECPRHSGFDVCCERPDLHVAVR